MTNAELVDSKKFCSFMDELLVVWPKADDGQRVLELFRLLEATGWRSYDEDEARKEREDALPKYVPPPSPFRDVPILVTDGVESIPEQDRIEKKRKGRPKGSKNRSNEVQEAVGFEAIANNKAALLAEMRKPLTPAEVAQLTKEAMAEAAKVRDPQLVVNDAVEQVIKPNWDKTTSVEGFRHFIVKANRNGEQVSFEVGKWQQALSLHGLPSSNITFKPEGLGMSPGSLDTNASRGKPWRVMIG